MRSRSQWYAVVSVLASAACSSSSSPTTEADASTPDGGADTGSLDASTAAVNGCGPTQFATNDHSAPSDPRAIAFATTSDPVQFSPSCMSIKAGQTVTWSGDFTDHPLEPTTDNTPIVFVVSGTTASFTFPAAGTFGYDCAMHPSIMRGAIQVVP